MGLSRTVVRQLLHASRTGASFTSVLMIGRQSLYLRDSEIEALNAEFSIDLRPVASPRNVFADEFFRSVLGAQRVDSMDASPFEGATVIHDLNHDVPSELHRRYDAVVDGGSLEHVFNVPVALANIMTMTTVGGRVYAFWPANNLCGHGFFQFSPEFAYRAFGSRSGFETERVALVESRFPSVELTSRPLVLDVADPDTVARRVLRMSARPALLMVQAHKLEHLDHPFADAPQQSDYAARWEAHSAGNDARRSSARARLDRLPQPLVSLLRGGREIALASRFNRRVYRRSS